ncbi:MAG: maleamate amidohydrolase [Cryomorphaceae bacterium]|jgi:maleamate amidohydrolase
MQESKDKISNYKRAYDNKLGYGKRPALILVDFVEAYFDESCELYADVDHVLASALRVREAANAQHVPIIFTNLVYQQGGADGGVFFQKVKPLRHFQKGQSMGAWPKGVEPADNELVISKQYPSAFFGTSLATTLRELNIDSLIITGLTTSGCIRATCVDCVSHGFIPIVVSDSCGDRHEDPHQANLFDMDAKYADVVSEASVITYLNSLRCD